jgi:Na+/H+ antiporter NhaD/arsenite permease-like protein
MLIGQWLDLPFATYLLDGAVPATLGLLVVWWILARAHSGRFERELAIARPPEPPFDRWQSGKALAVLGILTAGLLLAPLEREVQALLAGGVLLLSRRLSSHTLLGLVDWQLLVLFAGLFVCNHAFQQAGHAATGFQWLNTHGLEFRDPKALFAASVVGSNVVSNVPLTMLLLPVAEHPQAGAILALATTLAGNLLLVGSIANLIVVEQALRLGVRPHDRSWLVEHLRTGVPITLITLAIAAGWLWLRS